MSDLTNRSLPEPILPEHQLIRDSAPVPELSAGFRQRVLQECGTRISEAKTVRRWKMAGAVATACCMGLAFCLATPMFLNDSAGDPVLVNPGPTSRNMSPEFASPGSLGYPGSSGMAVDMPKPTPARDPEKSQMNQMIETLNNRHHRVHTLPAKP